MFPRYLNRSRYPERAYPARHSERQHNGRAYNRRCEATPIREQSRTQLDLINFAQITHNAEIEKKPAKKWKLVDEIKEEKWRLDLSDLQLVSDDEQDGEVVAAVLETERTLCKDFCFFNYTSQKASITLKSKYGTWNILKTKILYCSRDEREVKEYSWKDVEKQKRLEFCVAQLDRNVFEKLFKIQFQFAYNDEPLIYDNVFWVEINYFPTFTKPCFIDLEPFDPDQLITKVFKANFKAWEGMSTEENKFLTEIQKFSEKSSLEQAEFPELRLKMLKHALNIDCLASDSSLQEYEIDDVVVAVEENEMITKEHRSKKKEAVTTKMSIKISDQKKLPQNFKKMVLVFTPMTKFQTVYNVETDCIYSEKIEGFRKGRLYFQQVVEDVKQNTYEYTAPRLTINTFTKYHLKFISNRVTTRTAHKALQMVSTHNLEYYFKTCVVEDYAANGRLQKMEVVAQEEFEFQDPNIGENNEQVSAIKNIVNCSAYPSPHIIFGPPGTGKTSVLVESIVQILKLRPNSHILISAQSNSACDEIGVRLLRSISRNKIYRFYSPSCDVKTANEELKSISNMHKGKNEYPTYEELYHFNVVIATLVTAGRLVQMQIKTDHFDYVFVDECAASTEPECWIPIVGLVTEPHTILANVIFLGDHKQLGPIIESSQAKKLGLAESLMERLMKLPKYSEPFNPRFVTQLLNNFRSHEAILHFSNFQFYDGKLRPMADPKEVDFAVGWNLLPNKEFPLILHSVVNPCSREKNSYSWVNLEEVSVVLSYVDELLKNGINGKKISQTDIGIVTPYKAQLARLKTAFTARPGIEIGTSEYYQGREKNIMIISTVKSGGNIGFLKDPRRLNVALTRARSLMILVCNPTTMQKDEMWHSFIEFLIKNNAIVGEICAELKVVDEIVESFDDSFDDEEEMEGAVCP